MVKQKGVALITVLLIVALVTIVAAEMAVRLQFQIKRTENLAFNQQAYWFAMGGESLVSLVLNESLAAKSGQFNLSQPWAVEEMSFPLEGGATISGSVKDLSSCFNLNASIKPPAKNEDGSKPNVSNEQSRNDANDANDSGRTENSKTFDIEPEQQLQFLLENAGLDSYDAEQVRDAILDWLDADSITRGYGAEDYVYEAKAAPYITANGHFVDLSELKLIQGLDTIASKNVLDDLLELACVVPNYAEQTLNVNTIKDDQAGVLTAMFGNKLSMQDAKSIISTRPIEGFAKIEDFWDLSEIKAIGNISARVKKQFSVTSKYFKLKTRTEYNQSWVDLSSIFALDKNGKFVVIARKIGV